VVLPLLGGLNAARAMMCSKSASAKGVPRPGGAYVKKLTRFRGRKL